MKYILIIFSIVILTFVFSCIVCFICKRTIINLWSNIIEFVRYICISFGEKIENTYNKISLYRYKHINLYVDKETCDVIKDYMMEDDKIENGMYYKLNIFDEFETPIPQSMQNYIYEIYNYHKDYFYNLIKPYIFSEIWKNGEKTVHRYFMIIKNRCRIEIDSEGMYYDDGKFDSTYHLDSLNVPIEVFREAIKSKKFDYINFC